MTTSLPRSSGEPTADRRADYAEMLFGSGDHAAAAEIMLGALELAPGWALGWFRLGEMQEAAGEGAQAVQAWRMALSLDGADRAGAALKLELAGALPRSTRPPVAFVEALYDQYADSFEASLVGQLSYSGPERMMEAIAVTGVTHFRHAIDLGCGTGLMGAALRPICDRLEGIDLSARILDMARSKGVYDSLRQADIATLSLPAASVDLVTAADVFIYVGALNDIVARLADALAPGGVLAFSVETHDGDEPCRLRETRRYAHALGPLVELLERQGFVVDAANRAAIRLDRRQPVDGLFVAARKP